MSSFADRVRTLALAWGAPGLFLVAFLDSSFLPLPGITDILLIVLVARLKDYMLLYVVAATLGSVAGCLVMHAIGKAGGAALVRRRFGGQRVERATALLRQYGVMSVLIPSLLPPPAPFKIFILLAGVIGISRRGLAAAIAIGRGIRYLALGLLAYRYGNRASVFLAEHGAEASLVLVGVLVAALVVALLMRRRPSPAGSGASGLRNR
jgi:membrane protein YqaA with SNARE-associated domain